MTSPGEPPPLPMDEARTRTWVPRGETAPAPALGERLGRVLDAGKRGLGRTARLARGKVAGAFRGSGRGGFAARVSAWLAACKRWLRATVHRVAPARVRDFLLRHGRTLGAVAVAGVVLAFLVFGSGGSGGSGDSGPGDNAVAPTDREERVVSPSPAAGPTMCGDEDARPPRRIGADDWEDYSCQPRRRAANWSACLRRGQYTRRAGMGCPGRQRCCPSD